MAISSNQHALESLKALDLSALPEPERASIQELSQEWKHRLQHQQEAIAALKRRVDKYYEPSTSRRWRFLTQIRCFKRRCRVPEGRLHVWGCDMEECPWCGKQLWFCGCLYDKLAFDFDPRAFHFLKNPLTDAQLRQVRILLHEVGRVPFFWRFNLCKMCGELDPELFMVPNAEWDRHIPPSLRKHVLCRPCYDQVKAITVETWRRARNPTLPPGA